MALQCSEYWASRFAVDHVALAVIQAPKLEPRIMRYELTDYEWAAVRPFLPNKPRGVPRVNDRRVLNGIFWVLRSGAPWRDLPETFGPYTPATIASFAGAPTGMAASLAARSFATDEFSASSGAPL